MRGQRQGVRSTKVKAKIKIKIEGEKEDSQNEEEKALEIGFSVENARDV